MELENGGVNARMMPQRIFADEWQSNYLKLHGFDIQGGFQFSPRKDENLAQ